MTFPIDKAVCLLEQEVRSYKTPIVDLIAAHGQDPFQVLVATILSGRTRDEVTAQAVERLFAAGGNTMDGLASLTKEEIEHISGR